MKALAIVQARMSSSRLPGKVLADVGSEPMLSLLLRRLARAQRIDRVVVATSVESEDAAVADVAHGLGVDVARGPLDDVLERFVQAMDAFAGPVVRITGDCPLIDPSLVDSAIAAFLARPGCAYASNIAVRTYPDGLDVEVIEPAALRVADAEATDPSDREHVTALVRRDPKRFPAVEIRHDTPLGDLRWVVDTEADLAFVRAVVVRLGDRRYEASLEEILEAVRTPPSLAGRYGGRRG